MASMDTKVNNKIKNKKLRMTVKKKRLIPNLMDQICPVGKKDIPGIIFIRIIGYSIVDKLRSLNSILHVPPDLKPANVRLALAPLHFYDLPPSFTLYICI